MAAIDNDQPFFLTASEAARFLRIKAATIYDWVHQRKIPFRKHGGRLVFVQADLQAFSKSTEVLPRVHSWQPGIGDDMVAIPQQKQRRSLKTKQDMQKQPSPPLEERDGRF